MVQRVFRATRFYAAASAPRLDADTHIAQALLPDTGAQTVLSWHYLARDEKIQTRGPTAPSHFSDFFSLSRERAQALLPDTGASNGLAK